MYLSFTYFIVLSPIEYDTTVKITPNRNQDVSSTQQKLLKNVKSPGENKVDFRKKNVEILKYVFPFYDEIVLNTIYQGCQDDVLQTVLSISSCVLNKQRRYSPFDNYDNGFKPHMPLSPSIMNSERCCESPYCPVNSYIALRRRDSTSPYPSFATKRFSFNEEEFNNAKRSRFSPSEISITDKLNRSPYCTACKRLGSLGDKFCPLCGVSY